MLCFILLAVSTLACSSKSPIEPEDGGNTPPPTGTPSLTAADVLTLDAATGKLRKDGKDYYGAGVNYYDAFYRVIIDQSHADVSYREGFRILQELGIPFIRFSVLGFYPNDYNYYRFSEINYFATLDAFVAAANEYNIGLIPSFFWNHSTVSDHVGEPVGAWAKLDEPGNRTNEFMETYVEKMVRRYGDNAAIWAWEFGNEANIKVDPVGMTFEQQSWIYPIVSGGRSGGLPETRTFADTLSSIELNGAFNKFQSLLRKNEDQLGLPHRAVFSGNTAPTFGAHARYHGRWEGNTAAELHEVILLQNGDLGTVTIHPYVGNEGANSYNTTMANIIAGAKAACDQAKKALFIGEWGVSKSHGAGEEQKFREYVDAIKNNDIQLSALWVFDTLGGAGGYMDEWVITPSIRPYQLEGVVEINNYFKTRCAL